MNIKKLINDFEMASHKKNALNMKNYMQGKFNYYGIKTPERRGISKDFIKSSQKLDKKSLKVVVLSLYDMPQRELHHIALELCIPYFKKHCEISDIHFFEVLASKNQWWDSIDVIAPKLMGNYFLNFPNQRDRLINKWLKSKDKWFIRCALLFQLKYKTKTDLSLLFETILRIPPSDEFFINKAIGWVLRENTRLFPEAIIDFVNDNKASLSSLSQKEALRLL